MMTRGVNAEDPNGLPERKTNTADRSAQGGLEPKA
jgi:hypothetical protein